MSSSSNQKTSRYRKAATGKNLKTLKQRCALEVKG
jgi:hypothetical protein